MKTMSRILSGLLVLAAICSCSETKWSYEKDAVQLRITGDPALNRYQNNAHTLIVCAYQLKDLNGFNQLIDEKGGLEKLLECSRFDPGVTYTKRLVIQPNQKLTETMNRTEDMKHLGIVAGYYYLTKEHAVRAYPVPVSWLNNPKKLDLDIHMGPEGIQTNKEQK